MLVRFLSRVVEEFSFAQAFWNMLTMCGVDPLSLAVLAFSGPKIQVLPSVLGHVLVLILW